MKYNVINLDNKVTGEIALNDSIFGVPFRADILHRVIEWQRSKRRAGTHQTKTISMVSGTTKKPYKQKGTGNARHGSLRSAQFRGGGIIFGPVTRSHEYDLQKKVRKLALKIALSEKLSSQNLVIVDSLALNSHKTKQLHATLTKLNLNSALFIGAEALDQNFALASANIPHVSALPSAGLNVYDIAHHEKLVITVDALKMIEARLS